MEEIQKLQQENQQLRCEVLEEKIKLNKAECILKRIQKSFASKSEEDTALDMTSIHAWGMIDAYFQMTKPAKELLEDLKKESKEECSE